jgi:hypothetical protein
VLKKYDPDYENDKVLAMKAEFNHPLKVSEQLRLPFHYSEELFKYFGADVVDSMDNSDYESATVIHDLNTPVGEELKNKYSCVWDGGTPGHVFNYPAALKNCMEMTCPGGYIVLQTPANNYFGHGSYQLQPDIFFSVLCEQNGFTDTRVLAQDNRKRWFEIVPPAIVKDRYGVPLNFIEILSKKAADRLVSAAA